MADAGDRVTELKVVPIRECNANLRDIPGMLRQMADNIERGEYDQVDALIVVMPRHADYPLMFGWGDVEGDNAPLMQLELAKMFLLTRTTERKA